MLGFLERRRQKRLEGLWKTARESMASGQPKAALAALDSILGEEVDSAEGFLMKVRGLKEMGKIAEARQILANLAQWSDPAVRERVNLERAREAMDDKQWVNVRGLLPVAAPPGEHWRWLEAALRCRYELMQSDEFRRLRDTQWRAATAEELQDPRNRQALSNLYVLLGSFVEDESGSARVTETHYKKALELWPQNEEAQRSLEELQAEAAEARGGEVQAAEGKGKASGKAAKASGTATSQVEEVAGPAQSRAAGEAGAGEALVNQARWRASRERLAELRQQVEAALAGAPSQSELDLYEGLVLLQEQRAAEAVPLLNLARENEALKMAVFPRLVVAHLLLQDKDGIDESFTPWEKWLGNGLEAASPEELQRWEAPLADYIELGAAIGRLQSWRLQRWNRSLLMRGCGASPCFQMLFQADTGLRVMQEPSPTRGLKLLQRFALMLPPELEHLTAGL